MINHSKDKVQSKSTVLESFCLYSWQFSSKKELSEYYLSYLLVSKEACSKLMSWASSLILVLISCHCLFSVYIAHSFIHISEEYMKYLYVCLCMCVISTHDHNWWTWRHLICPCYFIMVRYVPNKEIRGLCLGVLEAGLFDASVLLEAFVRSPDLSTAQMREHILIGYLVCNLFLFRSFLLFLLHFIQTLSFSSYKCRSRC